MAYWDRGLWWRLVRTVNPEASLDPLTVAAVRDDHLKLTNGSAEDAYVQRLIDVSLAYAERITRRRLLTQTWALLLDRFPAEYIELPIAPIQEVVSITYVDPDGVTQTWGSSPFPYVVTNPTVESNEKATIRLGFNETFPSTRAQPEAVRVTVTVGYPEVGSPLVCDVPDDIEHGRLLVIGELYKQRTESVHGLASTPAIIRARDLWLQHRVY